MDPHMVEPGARVTLPVILTLPSDGHSKRPYSLTFEIRIASVAAADPEEPPAYGQPEGLPHHSDAVHLGIRVLRNYARERELAPWRKVGGMSKSELIDLLYRVPSGSPSLPKLPNPTPLPSPPLADASSPAERLEEKEAPRRVLRYARQGPHSKLVHRRGCKKLTSTSPIEMSTAEARHFLATSEVNALCAVCQPPI